MAKVPVNGIEIYYEVHGEGPPLVFAHDVGGNHLAIVLSFLAEVDGN